MATSYDSIYCNATDYTGKRTCVTSTWDRLDRARDTVNWFAGAVLYQE